MLILSLKNQKEFDLVNRSGKKLYSPYFILVIAKNFSLDPSEPSSLIFLGMKVSKKLGCAVIRNKIKRRIRHLVRLVSKNRQLKLNKLGIIIIPKKGFEKIEFATLCDELEKTILIA